MKASKDLLMKILMETRFDLNEVEKSLEKITNLTTINEVLNGKIEQFEASSGFLLEEYHSLKSKVQYLCSCGSNIEPDRKDEFEESRCIYCLPNQNEIEPLENREI